MALEPPDSHDDLKPMVLQIVAQNASLLGRIDELLAQNAKLLARIAELEAKSGQPPKTPDNSSLPPSSAHKANVAAKDSGSPRTKGRKGRVGVARTLAVNPDATREIYADKCACGAALSETDQPDRFAYDHIDLPPIKPVTTRIHLHKGHCPCCNKRVTAAPPADMMPGTPFGPGIVALVTYLHACQMVSYSRMIGVLGGLFGLKISEGALANMLARAEKPFAAQAGAIADIVRASDCVASDETSARVCGKTHWQWTFVTKTAVAHVIAPTRGKAVPVAFLGKARPKIWLSGRYGGQGRLGEAHQYCLAHLLRDAQYAIDAGDREFAPAFKAFLRDACAIGRRRNGLTDISIREHARRLASELERVLGLEATHRQGRHLRDSMSVDARNKLLVFLSARDCEPTNNASERALRPSVIFRKVTNGFRSGWGAKVYADVCSIVATGKLAGRCALKAIRDALSVKPATA
jgi:transposase